MSQDWIDSEHLQQLRWLQLTSSTLPVGAFSYSEGLESLVDQDVVSAATTLESWILQELTYGSIRLESAIVLRAYQATLNQDADNFSFWNHWWSAARETEELRLQSWQMGRSLLQLFLNLEEPYPAIGIDKTWPVLQSLKSQPCNFAVVFGLVAAAWQINSQDAILGFLQSWTTNLVAAGIKLIPLGQTAGQQLLLNLQPTILIAAQDIVQLCDQDLESCGWGLALASMAHETQYSRLFRS